MDKSILEKHVQEGLSQRAMASLLGKSQTCVKYWLKKHGLCTKYIGESKDICKHCGETDKEKFVNKGSGRKSRSCCKSCHSKYTIDRFRKYRIQAIEYKGGKCIRCDYDKCVWSLDFHHRDPEEKDLKWRHMRTWKFDNIKSELDKCDLVCANCHREIHYELSGV